MPLIIRIVYPRNIACEGHKQRIQTPTADINPSSNPLYYPNFHCQGTIELKVISSLKDRNLVLRRQAMYYGGALISLRACVRLRRSKIRFPKPLDNHCILSNAIRNCKVEMVQCKSSIINGTKSSNALHKGFPQTYVGSRS